MTAVSRAAATAQHLLLLGTLERGPVPLPMSGFKSTAASQPARTQIDSYEGAATAGQGQGGQAGRTEVSRIDRARDSTSADGDQADQQGVDCASGPAAGGQGGKTTGSAPTSGGNEASNSPAVAGQTNKTKTEVYLEGRQYVLSARRVESVQGRQYVLWAKGVRQLDAVNEWFRKAGFQPVRSPSCTKAAATNSAAVFEKALQELTTNLKNLSEVTAREGGGTKLSEALAKLPPKEQDKLKQKVKHIQFLPAKLRLLCCQTLNDLKYRQYLDDVWRKDVPKVVEQDVRARARSKRGPEWKGFAAFCSSYEVDGVGDAVRGELAVVATRTQPARKTKERAAPKQKLSNLEEVEAARSLRQAMDRFYRDLAAAQAKGEVPEAASWEALPSAARRKRIQQAKDDEDRKRKERIEDAMERFKKQREYPCLASS